MVWLTENFLTRTEESRGGALCPTMKMEITLKYLADPGFQASVAQFMGVTQPTMCHVIAESLNSMSAKASDWIKFPTTDEEHKCSEESWLAKLGFPCTVGALDCTHVRIEKPGGQFGDDFVNRKNYASFNVQVTCNEKYHFPSIDVGWPGSVHDSRILKTSALYMHMQNIDGILLGDNNSACREWLL